MRTRNKIAITICSILFLFGSAGAAQARLLGLLGPPPPPPAAAPPSAPSAPPGAASGRRIVYSNSQQRVWLYEANGQLARTYPVSGRRGVPRPGRYRIFSKSRVSTAGSLRLNYMMRFAPGRPLAAGFHAIPVRRDGSPIQSEAELGSPRSHGCVRQSNADAVFLWNWADIGTPVELTP
jgi:hypothetical protein